MNQDVQARKDACSARDIVKPIGNPGFDSGRFHKHCGKCPDFGLCGNCPHFEV